MAAAAGAAGSAVSSWLWPTLISAGSGLLSGMMGQKGSQSQAGAASQAAQLQYQEFAKAQANLQPYMNMGYSAMNPLMGLMGLGGSGQPSADVMNKFLSNIPGFQFTNYWGQKAVQNSMASRGLANSGPALAGAAQFATGLAQQNYESYLNNLMNVVGMGQNAAAGQGGLMAQAGQTIGNTIQNMGAAQAAGYNSLGAGLNNAGNMASQFAFIGSMFGDPGGGVVPDLPGNLLNPNPPGFGVLPSIG